MELFTADREVVNPWANICHLSGLNSIGYPHLPVHFQGHFGTCYSNTDIRISCDITGTIGP